MFAASKTASVSGGYQISRSLRFNSADSAYLNRTPASAGNRTTWTYSTWLKLTSLANEGHFLDAGNDQFVFYGAGNIALFDGSNTSLEVIRTTQLFRDFSAWYHVVLVWDTTQATASNRVKLYINGSQVTAFATTNYPAQNATLAINNNVQQRIGAYTGGGNFYFNGYMTEINFIDGQALTPSSFGETNAQTGVWQPKAYSGSYGTNGFYLNFSDNSNTTAATLGKDYSGNGNNWTPNNFSVTAGAGNDSLVDSPTSYDVDTGVGGTVRGNYCTMNPIANPTAPTYSITNGNLDYATTGGSGGAANQAAVATIGVTSGKWYYEGTVTSNNPGLGFSSELFLNSQRGTIRITYYSGSLGNSAGITATGSPATFTNGDVIAVAYDADAGTATVYKNNTSQGTFSGIATGTALFPYVEPNTADSGSGVSFNFGQRPFAYTAPSGFKALCTQNLPTPTIGATTATQAALYFTPTTYTGNGSSSRAITNGINMASNGGLVWSKQRSGVESNFLIDNIRGSTKYLMSNSVAAENTISTLVTSFDSTGYSIGNDSGINANGSTYVSWVWGAGGSGTTNTAGSITSTVSANTTSGFSIARGTLPSSGGASYGHGLGVAPSFIFAKSTSSTSDWFAYHTSLGFDKDIRLNTTSAVSSTTFTYNSADSSIVTIGGGNVSAYWGGGSTWVWYNFAEVAGYSKFGSYTGNGSSANGPFVYTGFRPAYVMIKQSDAASNWIVEDATRDTYNVASKALYPNSSAAEDATFGFIDILSNGFKIRNADAWLNGTGSTYIFMAFASNPFKYSLAR